MYLKSCNLRGVAAQVLNKIIESNVYVNHHRSSSVSILNIKTARNCELQNRKRNLITLQRRSESECKIVENILKKMNHSLPFFATGKIIQGFGRGSKELGIPTANYDLDVVRSLPETLEPGVYYGWANVNNGDVHKMVMSIGWNPYYHNKEKSMETHILYNFDCDLYGALLKVCIVGYLRPEKNFNSLEELIDAIKTDITDAEQKLEENVESKKLKDSIYFKSNNNNNNNNNAATAGDEHKNGTS